MEESVEDVKKMGFCYFCVSESFHFESLYGTTLRLSRKDADEFRTWHG